MNLLVDEALQNAVALRLAEAGHDAAHVRLLGLAGHTDDEVMALALLEDRVLVTTDTDFGTILALTGAAPSESPTLGFDRAQARALLTTAAEGRPRDLALVSLLLLNGLRVNEATSATVADLETVRGHRVLTIDGKGSKVRRAPLAPRTVAAVEGHLADRTTGPLVEGYAGTHLTRSATAQIVRRVARHAGIAEPISPHSLRHTFVTLALVAGVPLQVVQDGAGHADPRTTRRYDRARHNLDGHSTYALTAWLDR